MEEFKYRDSFVDALQQERNHYETDFETLAIILQEELSMAELQRILTLFAAQARRDRQWVIT